MFRSPRLTCAITLLAVSTLVPSPASAEHYRSKGNAAELTTFEADSAGCIYIDTRLTIAEDQVRSGPGPTEPSTGIHFSRTVYNHCNDYYLMIMNVTTNVPNDAFSTDSQLRSASFQTTVMVTPWIYGEGVITTPEPLTFDLVWTGGTDIQNGGRTNRDRNVGYLRIARSTGTYRPAAISGSVTFRSANMLGTQYSHATLANYTSSEVIHLQRPN